jgi:amidohydrolase
VSRSISPIDSAVLTLGTFHAGTASNIIPQVAVLEGTLRTIKPDVRECALGRLREILRGIELAHGVKAELQISIGYPLLVNDPNLVRFVELQAKDCLGDDSVHHAAPRMGSEDFAFFVQKFPGILIGLGCSDPEKGLTHGLHSPHFDLDERVLDVGVRLFTHLLTSYEAHGQGQC